MFQTRLKTHHSAMADGNEYFMGPRNIVEVTSTPQSIATKDSTIYIHIPFCSKICSFCNMRRSLSDPYKEYADLIVREIEEYSKLPFVQSMVFDAVYFGGGTPTTLEAEDLKKILRALKAKFSFTADAEFTIETTVTELSEEKLHMFYEEGVNRFSVGIQTFYDEGRAQLGRKGNGEYAYSKLRTIKDMGFQILSMDVIYNYPNQTLDILKGDLDKIIELDLDGFSMYSLINMKETKIGAAGDAKLDEEMFYFIGEYMEAAGYSFLELTKMVKGDSYKYIMNRHRGGDTLPLGQGAGGSVNGLAMMNPIERTKYEETVVNFCNRTGMYFNSDYKETVKFKGDIQTLYLPHNETLYKDIDAYFALRDRLLLEEMIKKDKKGYRLTHKGIFWGNTLSRELSSLI